MSTEPVSPVAQMLEAPISESDLDSGTPSRLLAAAVELFSFRGYEGVSVREIERQATANRGSVAYHYGSKDTLWKEAFNSVLGKFQTEMFRYRELGPILPPMEMSRVLLHMYGRFGGRYPEFFRLLLHGGSDASERGEWVITQMRPVMAFLFEITGAAADRSPEEMAQYFFMFAGAASMVHSMPVLAKGLAGFESGEAGFVETFTEAAVNVFLPYFSKKGAQPTD